MRKISGEVRKAKDGSYSARITMLGRERRTYPLAASITMVEQAEARCSLLADLAARFRRAGKLSDPDALRLLDMAASAAEALLPGVENASAMLVGGQLPSKSVAVPTFEEIGKDWTTGELSKKWPDHVKAKKDVGIDEGRLKWLCNIQIAGMRAGDIPIDKFTLAHAEEMMRQLPEAAESPTTRRHYAIVLGRIVSLAVYPLKCIPVSPLPRNFLPKLGKPPRFPYLYPKEEAALLAHKTTPLAYRVLFGFLAREGCRESEAFAFQVRDFNLDVGSVRLDENKTDDPRSWALDPSVTVALRRWVELKRLQPDDRMFCDEDGEVLTLGHRLAEVLRAELHAAGVDRRELHYDGKNTRRLRVHDLRGTFVTINLANGKTETWVQDRTGHQSSGMVNRYRKQAREVHELNLGELSPMDLAIPELRPQFPANSPQIGGRRGKSTVTKGHGVLRSRAEVPRRAYRLRRSGLRR
jgi:integrase